MNRIVINGITYEGEFISVILHKDKRVEFIFKDIKPEKKKLQDIKATDLPPMTPIRVDEIYGC